jgi:hypothetical protein
VNGPTLRAIPDRFGLAVGMIQYDVARGPRYDLRTRNGHAERLDRDPHPG